MSDLKDRLKQWGEDGYIDADLRAVFQDSLAHIEKLEAALKRILAVEYAEPVAPVAMKAIAKAALAERNE